MTTPRLPAPERRRQLLEVARSVLAKDGYHETTMSDIARAAGVTKPVLYQHFSSKRDLYRNVLEDIGARLERVVIEAATEAASPRERASAGIDAYVKFVENDVDGFHLLFSGGNRQDEEWASITSGVEESLAQAIASLIEVPSASAARRRALAHGVIGMAESMMRHALGDTTMSYDRSEVAGDIAALLWSGLRGIDSGAG